MTLYYVYSRKLEKIVVTVSELLTIAIHLKLVARLQERESKSRSQETQKILTEDEHARRKREITCVRIS